MRFLVRLPLLHQLCCLLSHSSLACLLAQLEDRTWCFVQRAFYANRPLSTRQVLSRASAPGGWVARPAPAGPRVYVVDFQLTLAELRYAQVMASYVAPAARLFDTDELSVIWAELVDELGTSPYRLGLEILTIAPCPLSMVHPLPSQSGT